MMMMMMMMIIIIIKKKIINFSCFHIIMINTDNNFKINALFGNTAKVEFSLLQQFSNG